MFIHRSLLTAGLAAALVGGLGLSAFSQTPQSPPLSPELPRPSPASGPKVEAEVTVKGWPTLPPR